MNARLTLSLTLRYQRTLFIVSARMRLCTCLVDKLACFRMIHMISMENTFRFFWQPSKKKKTNSARRGKNLLRAQKTQREREGRERTRKNVIAISVCGSYLFHDCWNVRLSGRHLK